MDQLSPRIVLLIVNRVFRNERNSKNTQERTSLPPPSSPPLLSVSYRKVRRPKRSWLGSLSYAVFIRGGRSVPPSIKPVDSGGRWQSDAGRRCERICRGPPHFRFEPRFEQPRGSSDRSWTICEFYVHALPFDRSLQVKRWIFRVKSFVTFSFFLFIYIYVCIPFFEWFEKCASIIERCIFEVNI